MGQGRHRQHLEVFQLAAIEAEAAGQGAEPGRIAPRLLGEAGGPPDQVIQPVGRVDRSAGIEGLHHHLGGGHPGTGGATGPAVDRFGGDRHPIAPFPPELHPPETRLVRLRHPPVDPQPVGALPHGGFFHQDLQVGGPRRRLGPQGVGPASAQAGRQYAPQARGQAGVPKLCPRSRLRCQEPAVAALPGPAGRPCWTWGASTALWRAAGSRIVEGPLAPAGRSGRRRALRKLRPLPGCCSIRPHQPAWELCPEDQRPAPA